MEREILFADKLQELKNTAKDQGGLLTDGQVRDALAGFGLDEGQLDMVYDYLKEHHIGIGEPADGRECLPDGERDHLKAYLEELKGLKKAEGGEREAVVLSAMAGDAAAQRRLIDLFLPQVVDLAKLYAGQGVPMEDLIGEGNVALTMGVTMLGAMENASEAEGMLARMVMDAMEEYIEENAEEGRKDKRIVDKVNRVADAAGKLAEELGRKVTVAELAKESGMSVGSIRDAVRLSGGRIEDLEKEV